jgi:anti-sigma regulatory factor (Ser/Thr protein kinase)
MTTGHGPDLLDGASTAPAGERALLRAHDLALHVSSPGSLQPARPGEPWRPVRVFGGTPDQVRAVRQFVREHLAGHPAASDAVLVASELAANSIIHSTSSRPGGQFLVHAAVTGDRQAGLIVTDQGGPFRPGWQVRGQHGESGRGLAVVRSLTSLFRICDHDSGHRSFIALITTTPDTSARESDPALAFLNLPGKSGGLNGA